MSNFKIGEKVVCLISFTGQNRPDTDKLILPIKNVIYTIRTIESNCRGTFIRLEEITNPLLKYRSSVSEAQFCIKKFRKLDHQFAEDVIKNLIETSQPVEV